MLLQRRKLSNAETYGQRSQDEIAWRIHEASTNRDEKTLNDAFQVVLGVYDGNVAPDNLQKPWVQTTALLCRTLQELGKMDEAAELLQRVVLSGPIDETDYFNHSPLGLIDSLLARDLPSTVAERKHYIPNLDLAATLFLPTLLRNHSFHGRCRGSWAKASGRCLFF